MSDTLNEENKNPEHTSEAASVQEEERNKQVLKEDKDQKAEPAKPEEAKAEASEAKVSDSRKEGSEELAAGATEKPEASSTLEKAGEVKKDGEEKKDTQPELEFKSVSGEEHPSERYPVHRGKKSLKPAHPFAGFSLRKMIPVLVFFVILGGVIWFITYFHVETVQIMSSTYYSDEEVKSMILTGPSAENTFLAPMFLNRSDVGEYPFVEGFSVTRIDHHTLAVALREMKPVGCILFLDSYIYFDRNGTFAESSMERDPIIPFFKDVQVNRVIKGEKLSLKGTAILDTAVILSNTFQKIDQIPEYIGLDASGQVNLYYEDITVQLGKAQYLEDKMSRVNAIMEKIAGRKGVLHVESVNEHSKIITFEEEVVEITAENWPGGYDENGDYDGVGEYDANGKYVGPKPHEAYDDAMEAWAGGYDGEGDYTGSGVYDASGNYVGEAPTREEFKERHAEWTGGWTEGGMYDGISPFDQEGYYVGTNPNGSSSGEGNANASSESESENYYDDYSDDYYESYDEEYYDESYYDESYYDDSYYDESYYDESYYDEGY